MITNTSTPDVQSVHQKIKNFIASKDYSSVIRLLDKENMDNDPELHAFKGLAYFLQESYGNAIPCYEAALKIDPIKSEWVEMLERSKINEVSEVHQEVPAIYFYDKEKLLAAPDLSNDSFPDNPNASFQLSFPAKIRTKVGNFVGAIATCIMNNLERTHGNLRGYRDTIWTNWYHRPKIFGILTLAYMRRQLNENNLINTYPEGSLIGYAPAGSKPPKGVKHFRTPDGSWNNIDNPKEGAAGTRFSRNVKNDAIIKESLNDLMSPNPRQVSNVFLTRDEEMKEIPFLNLLSVSWIQFQTHDWVSHGEPMTNDMWEIPFPEDDPARKKYWQTKMFVGKTQKDPTRQEGKENMNTSYINEVTHWWDGSQIYGSDQETIDRLRSKVDGKLRIEDDGRLPLDKKGIEETGFVRNWWVGLTMLHTVFTKEHNAICDHLKSCYPSWNDDQLFNVARLINAALMAKIHSIEWTPAILPNRILNDAMHANWYGLLTAIRSEKNRKTVEEINIRNTELGGIIGNPINKSGEPYSLTEEFTEVYRLHSLMPETLKIKNIARSNQEREIPMAKTRQAGSGKLTKEIDMSDLFFSFGTQLPGQLVLNNYPKFMKNLSIPGNPMYDMGAVDILRARERGVPRYNEFRRQLGLHPISKFEDLTDDPKHIADLKKVYGSSPEAVEQLDLMIGTLAEQHRPSQFGFGETMFQIFILNASRRLHADRFYTDDYRPEVYTPEGMEWIDQNTFKKVLLRHYPALAKTGLANVKNAFEPWDTDKELDPERHPLRAFDKDLKSDPWKGEANK